MKKTWKSINPSPWPALAASITKAPSASSGAWTDPSNAYSSDDTYASSSLDGQQQVYSGYGFNISGAIDQVRVRLDVKANPNDQIKLEVSGDGGVSYYATAYTSPSLTTNEQTIWVDVTSWTTWGATKLNNDKIFTRVTQLKQGQQDTTYLDYIAVEVNYTPPDAPTATLTPEDAATGVALDAAVTAVFNQTVTEADLSGVTITPDPGNVVATLDVDGVTVNIAHDDFDYETEYTVTIPAGAVENADEVGNAEISWSFTTEATPPSSYTLNITANNGTVNVVPDETSYDSGTAVELTAIADPGYYFVSWSGDATSTANPTTITMDSNKNITANFNLIVYDTGWHSPTRSDGEVFTDPDNAFSSDNSYAGGTNGQQQLYADFEFDIPAGAVINGIEVGVEAHNSLNSAPKTINIVLSLDGGESFTASLQTPNYGITDSTPILGSPTSKWGTTWEASSFSDANFRVRVQTNTSGTMYLDHLKVKVYYTYIPTTIYDLTVDSTAGGSVTAPGEGTFSYGDGTVVNLVATPASGYHFVNWTGDTGAIANTSAASTTITMNDDYSITANFAADDPNTYTLTYIAGDNGSITGTSPQTINHGEDGTEVTAVPDTGYHFVDWSDGLTTASRTDTNVTADITVTANFAADPTTYNLTVTSTAAGSVTVPGEDTFTYDAGEVVNLVAVADAGSYFAGWTGDTDTIANTSSASTTIIMNGNYYIVALFATDSDTDWHSPTRSDGEVFTDPDNAFSSDDTYAGGTNGQQQLYADFEFDIPAGAVINGIAVSLEAYNSLNSAPKSISVALSADGGETFTAALETSHYGTSESTKILGGASSKWGATWEASDFSDANFRVRVQMNTSGTMYLDHVQARVYYTYIPVDTYDLTIASTEGGSVTTPGEGTFTYDDGTVVNLVATPDEGYHFVNWTGATCSVANVNAASTTITMNGNKPITANFASDTLPSYTLTITAVNGTVTKNPNQSSYTEGTSVSLTAVANSGYNFTGWNGDASESANPLTVVMNSNKSITAHFALQSTGGGGGFGGVSLSALSLTGLTSPNTVYVDSSGYFQGSAQLTTTDGKVTFNIPNSTRMVTAQGTALTTMSAAPLTSYPAPPAGSSIVMAYDFGPSGATFSPPISVTFTYNPASLPAGTTGTSLSIAFWNGTSWQTLTGTVNTANNTITAQISHFSTFAVVAKLPAAPATTTPPATTPPATTPPPATVTPPPATTTPPSVTTPPATTPPAVTTPAATKPAATTAPATTSAPTSPTNWTLIIVIIVIVAVIIGAITAMMVRKRGAK